MQVYGFDYRPFKKWVALEPFVENCPRNILCTDECAVFSVDLMKVSTKELDFANKYELTINHDGYVNGLCLWFDTIFSFGKRPITLTTRSLL